MKSMLIYNPASGRVPVKLFIQRAVDELHRNGWSVDVIESQSNQDAVKLAQQAASEKYDVLFAAGGDGTIGQAAHGLAGSQTALGILPAGTSNVFALELGLQPLGWNRWWALEENIQRLVNAPIFSVDVGICNEKPFLLWAGIGLDALSIQKIEPRFRIEKYFNVAQYAAQTIWNATFWHGYDLRFYADGKLIEGHYMVTIVTNIRNYLGGLATLSPEAHLDDGQMDIWMFSGENLGDAFRHTFGMIAGAHPNMPDVQKVSFKSLRVESDDPFYIQLDGEPFPAVRRAELSILPRALRMMIPVNAKSLIRASNVDQEYI